MLRVGIVGCGKISDAHVEQARATGLAEVVAVADREPLMAQQISQRLGIEKRYTDVLTMIKDAKLDVIHVATPPDSHLAIARLALENGCHVFLEKPLALDTSQTQEILSLAEKVGRKVAVNYLYNFESPFKRLETLLAKGELGEIVHIESAYGYDLNGEYGLAVLSDPKHWVHRLPGKLFHNVLDHVMCKIAPFIGEDFQTVALASRRRSAMGSEIVDALPDELRFILASDRVSVSGYISAHAKPVTHTLKVLGTRNSYLLDFVSRTCTPLARQRFPGSIGRLIPAIDQARSFSAEAKSNFGAFWRHDYHFFIGMRRLLSAFYGSIMQGTASPQKPNELLIASKAIDAIVAAINPPKGESKDTSKPELKALSL
jgi:predicted dehydrogenase